ncbi:MAG: HD domain-containing protein [Clostridia bacterium]|nr:HD domain-containing protein [Clostridia bacterium]
MKDKGQQKKVKVTSAGFKEGVLPLIGVALIVFVLTVAVYFVAQYVASSYKNEDVLSGWEYLYTENPGAVPEGQLRILNAQNPLLTERAVRKGNLYLTKTITPEDTGKNLVVITDFAPIRIRLNGKDVYDNQFDSEAYVGNCYNAIYLEPSTHEQQIDVFLKLPFSVRFEAYLKKGGDPAFDLSPAMIFGAALAATGLIAAAVFAVAGLIRRRRFRSIIASGLLAYIGLSIVMHLLPESAYMLNNPLWLRLSGLSVQETFLITLSFLIGLFKSHWKAGLEIGLAAGVSVAVMMLSFTPLLVKISSVVMSAACLLAILLVTLRAMEQLERRTQYAAPAFVMCVFYALMALLAGVLLIGRLRVLYAYTVATSSFVVGCVLEYTYIHDYRSAIQNSGLREQSVKYGNSVELISVFIRNMLSCSDRDSFFRAVTEGLPDLLVRYNGENAGIAFAVAVKENGAFTEVFSKDVADCHFRSIEEHALRWNKSCLFFETYFDFCLKNGDEIGCIVHCENIREGLDAFFVSMLEAMYCGLETTYENLFVRSHKRDINIIFEELAENAELNNGCPVEHLANISRYTRALCMGLGYDNAKIDHIATASKLHDLGKIAVPRYIIEKQGRLNEEERIIINSHTDFGYTILSAYADDPLIATAATIARYHHEQYNGSGRNGLQGEQIPIEARIVTVCDVYDALVSERPYKRAWTKEEAMNYLADNAGKMFDPQICESFLAFLRGD